MKMRESQEKNDVTPSLQMPSDAPFRMKWWLLGFVCLCCLGVAGLFNGPLVRAEIIDRIAALFEEQLILLSEVREYANRPVVQLIGNIDLSQNVEDQTLQYMIERELLLREIQYLASPRETELNMVIVRQYIVKKYYTGDFEAFENHVQISGVGEEVIEQELMVYIKGVEYIRRKYRFSENIEEVSVVLKLFQQWVEDLYARANIQILL